MKKYQWVYLVLSMALCFGLHAEDDNRLERLSSWTQGTYLGPISVSLKIPKGIQARIETDQLVLHSITWKHQDDYLQLFGDPEAVKKYADGKPWTAEEVHEWMEIWINRWESLDPFSAFAVYLKGEQKQFIGHIVLGHGKNQGQAELAFLFKPEYMSQGYCKQATVALLYGYAIRLIKDNYFANIGSEQCEPSPLSAVHATVRFDDPYSAQALRRAGMKCGEVEILWGAQRMHYTMTTEEILNNKVIREEH